MKYILLMLLISCGTKNKVQVSGQVDMPTELEVKHKFFYDVNAIEDACEEKFQDVVNEQQREYEIGQCVLKKEAIMEQLFGILTKPTEES